MSRAYIEARKKGATFRFWCPADDAFPLVPQTPFHPPPKLPNETPENHAIRVKAARENWRRSGPTMQNKAQYEGHLRSQGYEILAQGTVE